jgi:3-hydroxyacyl-[acyl-carrier-protein] dehydratase
MDIEGIKTYVPHRYPFLMIDRVLSFEKGKSLMGLKNVTINEPCFQGHVPELAVFPGVLMIEALAQASGLLAYLSSDDSQEMPRALYYFGGMDKVRFKHVVVPGDSLKLCIELIEEKQHWRIVKTKATAFVEDAIACSAELLFLKKES